MLGEIQCFMATLLFTASVKGYVWEISLTAGTDYYSASRIPLFLRATGTDEVVRTEIKDGSYLIKRGETYNGYIRICGNVGNISNAVVGADEGNDGFNIVKVTLNRIEDANKWEFLANDCWIKPVEGSFTCNMSDPSHQKVIAAKATEHFWIPMTSFPVLHARYDVISRGIALPDLPKYITSSISECAVLALSSQFEGFSFSQSKNICTVFSLVAFGQRIVSDKDVDIYMFDSC